jgi:hypothetical protein
LAKDRGLGEYCPKAVYITIYLYSIKHAFPFHRDISIGSKSIINDAIHLEREALVTYNFDPEKKINAWKISFMIIARNAYNKIENSHGKTLGEVFGTVKVFVKDNPIQVVPIIVPSSHTPNKFFKSCWLNQPDI